MKQWAIGIALAALTTLSGANARAEFMAAAGKADITPTHPVYIAGYGENRLSVGAHDPLWARCLVMKNGNQMLALVSCDVIGLPRYRVLKMRSLIKSVPADRIMIGSTHTHSGPDTYGQWGPNFQTSGVDKAWMAQLCQKVATLVDTTARSLRPASLKFGNTTDVHHVSVNARIAKVLDTEVSVMQVLGKDGQTIATLINYACHPETMDNHLLTSDFPYWLRKGVEAKLGGVAIYMNGAQGGMVTADILNEDKYPKGEAWPEAERIGNVLSDKTLECLASVDSQSVENPAITFQSRVYHVPFQNERFKALMDAHILPSDGLVNGEITTEVDHFTIGPAEFVTLPGEVFPNIGLYLKRKMTGRPQFLLGLTNDAAGYIMVPEDYGLELYHYETSVCIGPEMGQRMIDNLLAMIEAKKTARK